MEEFTFIDFHAAVEALASITAFDAGDFLLGYDVSEEKTKRISVANLAAQLGAASVPAAKTDVAGKAKLSKAAADLSNPIVVSASESIYTEGVKTKYLADYASLATAVSTIGSSSATELVIADAVTISSNLTVTPNIILKLQGNAQISVNSGVTLTVGKMQNPGNRKIFAGAGTVKFSPGAVEHYNIAWWAGTYAGTPINIHSALNQTIVSCAANKNGKIYLPAGYYTTPGGHLPTLDTEIFGDGCSINGEGASVLTLTGTGEIFSIKQLQHGFTLRKMVLRGSTNPAVRNGKGVHCNDNSGGDSWLTGVKCEQVTFVHFTEGLDIHSLDDNSWQVEQVTAEQCNFVGCDNGVRANTINNTLTLKQCYFRSYADQTGVRLDKVGTFLCENHHAAGDNNDHADTFIYIGGEHSTVTVLGGQDEGYDYSIVHDGANLYTYPTTFTGNLFQGDILINHSAWITSIGNRMYAKAYKDDASATARVVSINDYAMPTDRFGTEATPRTINGFTGGSVLLSETNYQNGHINRHVSKFFLDPLFIASSTPVMQIGSPKVDGKLLRIGTLDNDEAFTGYYDIYRKYDTGWLHIDGSQADPYRGVKLNGPINVPSVQFTDGTAQTTAFTGSIVETALNLADNTTGNVSTSHHGFAPKLPDDANKFLNGVGEWTIPSGSGGAANLNDLNDADINSPVANDILQYNAGLFTNRTPAQVKATLLLSKADVGLSNADNTSDANKPVSTAQATAFAAKQNTLVSGTNIKTINGDSLLGSGNITISGGSGSSPFSIVSNAADLSDLLGDTSLSESNPVEAVVNGDVDVSSPQTIPSYIKIHKVAGGRFTKSGSGTIEFEGFGIADPLARETIFYGFSAGQVKWTGAEYPYSIAAQLWEQPYNATAGKNSLSTAIINANAAFKHTSDATLNKIVEIVAYPGHFDKNVIVSTNHTLRLTEGDFTNSTPSDKPPPGWAPGTTPHRGCPAILLENKSKLVGAGHTKTTLHGSSDADALPVLVYGTSAILTNPNTGLNDLWDIAYAVTAPKMNYDIEIADIKFQGPERLNFPFGGAAVAGVFLGNVENATIRNCHFDNWMSFSCYVGGPSGNANNYARNCWIVDNYFTRTGYCGFGVITGRNIHIERNTAYEFGAVAFSATATTTAGSASVTIPAGGLNSLPYINNWCVVTVLDANGYELRHGCEFTKTGDATVTLSAPIPSSAQVGSTEAARWTTSSARFEMVAQTSHIIDLEPNLPTDVLDNISVCDNVFDGTLSKTQYWYGIFAQSSAAQGGVRNLTIDNNKLIQDDESKGSGRLNGSNVLSGCRHGIYLSGCEYPIVTRNWLKNTLGEAIFAGDPGKSMSCYGGILADNIVIGNSSSAGQPAVTLFATFDMTVKGNKMMRNHTSGSGDVRIGEYAQTGTCNVSGSTVTHASGFYFHKWHKGKIITIAGSDYTVTGWTDTNTITVSPSPSAGTGLAYSFKGANNVYSDNPGATVSLFTGSTSKIRDSYTEDDLIALIEAYGGAAASYTDIWNYNYNGNSGGSPNVSGWTNKTGVTPTLFSTISGGGATFYDSSSTIDKSLVTDLTKLPPDNVIRSGFYWYKAPGYTFTDNLSGLTAGVRYKFRLTSWSPSGTRGNGAPSFSVSINGGTAVTFNPALNEVQVKEITFTATGTDTMSAVTNSGGGVVSAVVLQQRDA